MERSSTSRQTAENQHVTLFSSDWSPTLLCNLSPITHDQNTSIGVPQHRPAWRNPGVALANPMGISQEQNKLQTSHVIRLLSPTCVPQRWVVCSHQLLFHLSFRETKQSTSPSPSSCASFSIWNWFVIGMFLFDYLFTSL